MGFGQANHKFIVQLQTLALQGTPSFWSEFLTSSLHCNANMQYSNGGIPSSHSNEPQ